MSLDYSGWNLRGNKTLLHAGAYLNVCHRHDPHGCHHCPFSPCTLNGWILIKLNNPFETQGDSSYLWEMLYSH